MKKFNYFYRIENNVNGNYYYGVHRTSNLEDGYLGSGTRIIYAIKKYGKENFKKEILLFFDTYDEALDYEMKFVNEQLILDPSCYNIALGGGSWCSFNKTGKNLKTLRKGPAVINKNTNEIIKPNTIEEYYELFSTGNYWGHTKKHANFKNEDGKIFYLSVNDEKIKELNLHGVHYNKLMCKDKNDCVYWIDKDDERYLSGELVLFWKNRKHSEEMKQKCKITFKRIKHQQGNKNSQFGTKWITDGNETKKIKIDDNVPDGWKPGRKMKK